MEHRGMLRPTRSSLSTVGKRCSEDNTLCLLITPPLTKPGVGNRALRSTLLFVCLESLSCCLNVSQIVSPKTSRLTGTHSLYHNLVIVLRFKFVSIVCQGNEKDQYNSNYCNSRPVVFVILCIGLMIS